MGGRAAEQLVYGVVTTGAENDLRLVSQLATDMVTRWGMSQQLGVFATGRDAGSPQRGESSEATADVIDREIHRILDESYASARELLAAHRSQLDALAAALAREETLDGAAVRAVTGIEPEDEVGRCGPGRGPTSRPTTVSSLARQSHELAVTAAGR